MNETLRQEKERHAHAQGDGLPMCPCCNQTRASLNRHCVVCEEDICDYCEHPELKGVCIHCANPAQRQETIQTLLDMYEQNEREIRRLKEKYNEMDGER